MPQMAVRAPLVLAATIAALTSAVIAQKPAGAQEAAEERTFLFLPKSSWFVIPPKKRQPAGEVWIDDVVLTVGK
jgi:hypothetical protein